ncbi:MAG TPA: DNA mismatch repair protein MutH [Polyangia bacterium]|jgi:DNA mismatch repair protein MutH
MNRCLAVPPPADLAALAARAAALTGCCLGDLAQALGARLGADPVHAKGHGGELVERALGAAPGPGARHDFPHLGVELKTIPLDERGRPRESTFVCLIPLLEAGDVGWSASWVRAKLAHVLFVPLAAPAHGAPASRRVGAPFFWRPTTAQERVLHDDYDDLMGLIGVGGIEDLSAHAGRWLQVRPKAATSRCRAFAPGPDGEWLATVPRGFYLRARFTGALLADPTAAPDR